jgi:hypothetical protein
MRTATPTPGQTTPQPPTTTAPRRRTFLLPLVAIALVVAAAGGGVAIALASRTTPGAGEQPANVAAQSAAPGSATPDPKRAGSGQPSSPPASGPTAAAAPKPALADGSYDAFVRSVDPDHRTIVVDVVQVFEGDAADKAAIEDGKQGGAGLYVRNKNSLLRTLRASSAVRIEFQGTCEEAPPTGTQALRDLAKRIARFKEFYYYHFSVEDGLVQSMKERQAVPAC